METVTRKTNGITNVGIAGFGTDSEVLVWAMPVWQLIIVRVTRVYLSSFLGLISLEGMNIIDITVFNNTWNTFGTVALVATGPAFISLVQNAVEFLTQLDVKNPGWRA